MSGPREGSNRRAWLTGVFGTISVVASLGLVAWELRQNTVAVQAATYDRLSESSAVYLWEIARDPELAALFRRVFAGAPAAAFEGPEQTRISAVVLAFVTHLENSYRQYEAGVVSEEAFRAGSPTVGRWVGRRLTASAMAGPGGAPTFATWEGAGGGSPA